MSRRTQSRWHQLTSIRCYRLIRMHWNRPRFGAIKQTYHQRYGKTLRKRVEGEVSFFHPAAPLVSYLYHGVLASTLCCACANADGIDERKVRAGVGGYH